MAASTIRLIHDSIACAYDFAIKKGWADRNPADRASPPGLTTGEPGTADAGQAAALLEAVWEQDPGFGTFLRLAIVTGARRGELVTLRWSDISWQTRGVLIERSYVSRPSRRAITELKPSRKRRLPLDPATAKILLAHRKRQEQICNVMDVPFRSDGYMFTRDGLGTEPWLPDSVTRQFGRLRVTLGLSCRLDDLGREERQAATPDAGTPSVGPSDRRAAELLARGLPGRDRGTRRS